MSLLKEFREFTLRGNVLDLAIGIIIGAAFGSIVSSFVADIVMPLINPLLPEGDWRTMEIGPGIRIGSFMAAVLNFLVIAAAIFMMIKAINSFKRKEVVKPEENPIPSTEAQLLMEIRDLLKKERF